MPLRRTWSARSLIRAASRYQVSCPCGRRRQRRVAAADEHHHARAGRVGQHPRGQPRVAVQGQQRRGGGQHLVGRRGLHRHVRAPAPTAASPVIASVMRPVNVPRFGSATTGASAAARPLGCRVSRGVGDRNDAGLRGRRRGLRLRRPPALAGLVRWRISAAAATTAATSSSTTTPTTTWVDRRHRVGRMFLLISIEYPRHRL